MTTRWTKATVRKLAADNTVRQFSPASLAQDWLALDAEVDRLRRYILRDGVPDAPCIICGYSGPDYYQPKTHKCARLAP